MCLHVFQGRDLDGAEAYEILWWSVVADELVANPILNGLLMEISTRKAAPGRDRSVCGHHVLEEHKIHML
jgi:hypothetical protein